MRNKKKYQSTNISNPSNENSTYNSAKKIDSTIDYKKLHDDYLKDYV